MSTVSAKTLSDFLAPRAAAVEDDLERWLVESGTPQPLAEAMRYCALNGGKRLRPVLVRLSGQAVGAEPDDELVARAGVAVELVHCYSLVHDDLPALDNDVMRRGRPTAHVRFGEALAILTGDALLTRAFSVLAESQDPRSGRLLLELSRGAGAAGMVAGQVADMALCDVPEGSDGLRYVHERKTAALIRAAVRMGAICGGAREALLAAVSEYGRLLGLAFQVVDDVLDVTGQAETLGKTPGKDTTAGRPNSAEELGLECARQLGEDLSYQATAALEPLGDSAGDLRRLAELLAQRTY